MNCGSVFFDEAFAFHGGKTGEKLFIVLGTANSVSVISKTTSQQNGRGTTFGCQPTDRFHNFFLPPNSCYFKTSTWVCLDVFYELNATKALQKKFMGQIKPVCDLEDQLIRGIQDCAILSKDITRAQVAAIKSCLV